MMVSECGLMVIGNMARLHDCAPMTGSILVISFTQYIVGLEKPVVVASTWRIAGGLPSKLAAQASGITSHAPATLRKPCTFVLDKRLGQSHPDLLEALAHCARFPNSQWKVHLDKGQPLAASGVKAATISALATAIFKLRTLDVGSCRVYAADLQ